MDSTDFFPEGESLFGMLDLGAPLLDDHLSAPPQDDNFLNPLNEWPLVPIMALDPLDSAPSWSLASHNVPLMPLVEIKQEVEIKREAFPASPTEPLSPPSSTSSHSSPVA
jgi:hypothetical protein